jgi:two-component system sensor histidine kinase BaeS
MRWRLFLAFGLVVLVSVVSLTLLINANVTNTVYTFGQSGGFQGSDRLIGELESFYAENMSWEGVESLFSSSGNTGMSGTHSGSSGSGNGGGRGFGGSGFMPMMAENFALVGTDAQIIFSNNLELSGDLSADFLQYALPVSYQDETVAYLISQNNSYELNQHISDSLTTALTESMLPAVAITGVSAILVAVLFGYALNRPIHRLTNAAEKLADGDLSQRVLVKGKDEISSLAQTFNHMAASLQRSQENRRAVTADIAHELRTPLAVQRANLEALEDGVYPLTQENLGPVVQQNQLLTQLVEDLRTLAMTDSDSLELEKNPHNLVSLAEQIIENAQPQFEREGISLMFEHPEICPLVEIDPRRITQVLNNLLQNALRFTPKEGQVKISLECSQEWIIIKVQDSGEGIPTEALGHIFDRFYRADQSRAREKGGSGLGLAIARGLVEAHGGRLTAANAPEGGAVFNIFLPL